MLALVTTRTNTARISAHLKATLKAAGVTARVATQDLRPSSVIVAEADVPAAMAALEAAGYPTTHVGGALLTADGYAR